MARGFPFVLATLAVLVVLPGCGSDDGSEDATTLSDAASSSPPGRDVVLLTCGDEEAAVRILDDDATLTYAGEVFTMRRVRSASGAKYAADDDSTTILWNEGDHFMLIVRGRKLPECATGSQARPVPYQARGNEPFWSLEIDDASLTFRTPEGPAISAPVGPAERIPGGRRYTSASGGIHIAATVREEICVDDMSGMHYPESVTVVVGDREYSGCGGNPASLLRGGEWLVDAIAGEAVDARTRVSLDFEDGGGLTGDASCNRYRGRYELTGEGLTLSSAVATTRKGCTPEIMEQEKRFLDVLDAVRRFRLDSVDALVLQTDDGRTIQAHR